MVLVDKKPFAYRTIGEASKSVGVPTHVLRFWETKFSQIRPMKKGGGRRYYRPEDIELLSGIRQFLYEKDFSIKDLQILLRNKGIGAVAIVSDKTRSSSSDAQKSISSSDDNVCETNKLQAKPKVKKTDQDNTEPASQQASLRQALSRLTGARDKLSATLKNS